MTLLEQIDNIILKKFKFKVASNQFVLPEKGKQATCREVKFEKTSDILVYKFDEDKKFPFLEEGKTESMCDYIIFYSFKNDIDRTCVFICNLKSGNTGNNLDQMESGKNFAEFLIKTAIRLYNSNNENTNKLDFKKVKYKQILFSNRLLYTQPTNLSKQSQHNILNLICKTDTCVLDSVCNTLYK